MPLRPKIVLTLCAVMLVYAVVDTGVRHLVVRPAFEGLERREAEEDVLRVVEALREEIEVVHQLSRNWSERADTYAFVDEPTAAYVELNLAPTLLRSNRVDFLYVCDRGGRVVWRHAVDPDTGRGVELRAFPGDRLNPGHQFLHRTKDDPPSGLLLTEHDPMLLSARPIVPAGSSAEPRGTLLLGRFLGDGLVRDLEARTRVDFDFWQLDGRGGARELPPELIDRVTASSGPLITPESDELLHVWSTFLDARSRPDFLLRANVERGITGTGGIALRYALLSMVAAVILLVLALLALLQRIVLSPLSLLTRHAVSIGRREDFSAKLGLSRRDELGILSREFDQMMEKLEHARAQLVETARVAGMSEIATGILHNVGNVLNSVNISATLVARKVEELGIDELEQLSAVLAEHAGDLAAFVEGDPRGQHLAPYFCALVEQATEERGELEREVDSLVRGIDHIRELIKAQQTFAVRTDLEEPTDLAERIEEALRLADRALGSDAGIEVVRDYAELPPLLVDRHKLLEILVNLIRNARQALRERGAAPMRLSIRTEMDADGAARITVSDTGSGIHADHLSRVFQLGFTTKEGGMGYGLHTAANAAKELSGSLTARSDGPGEGATFVLEFPAKRLERTEAPA